MVAYIMLGLVVCVTVLVPFATRDISVSSTCLDKLRAIGEAMQAYTVEWNGRLPPADRWCDALHPKYLRSKSSFACKRARGEYGYAMNSKLSGAKLADIEDPSKVSLIFETTKTHRNAHDPLTSLRRDGVHRIFGAPDARGSGVLFADLKARIVPDDEKLEP